MNKEYYESMSRDYDGDNKNIHKGLQSALAQIAYDEDQEAQHNLRMNDDSMERIESSQLIGKTRKEIEEHIMWLQHDGINNVPNRIKKKETNLIALEYYNSIYFNNLETRKLIHNLTT